MYDYETTFTVLSLGTPSSTAIAGQWATDNLGGDILINGASTGITSSGFTARTLISPSVLRSSSLEQTRLTSWSTTCLEIPPTETPTTIRQHCG